MSRMQFNTYLYIYMYVMVPAGTVTTICSEHNTSKGGAFRETTIRCLPFEATISYSQFTNHHLAEHRGDLPVLALSGPVCREFVLVARLQSILSPTTFFQMPP
jgi:hypothetical protein